MTEARTTAPRPRQPRRGPGRAGAHSHGGAAEVPTGGKEEDSGHEESGGEREREEGPPPDRSPWTGLGQPTHRSGPGRRPVPAVDEGAQEVAAEGRRDRRRRRRPRVRRDLRGEETERREDHRVADERTGVGERASGGKPERDEPHGCRRPEGEKGQRDGRHSRPHRGGAPATRRGDDVPPSLGLLPARAADGHQAGPQGERQQSEHAHLDGEDPAGCPQLVAPPVEGLLHSRRTQARRVSLALLSSRRQGEGARRHGEHEARPGQRPPGQALPSGPELKEQERSHPSSSS